MLNVSVKTDIDRVMNQVTKEMRTRVHRAAASAINKTATAARKVGSQKIRERFALSAAMTKESIQIRRAGSTHLVALIEASGKPIPLREYTARETRRGVTYRVSKVRGRRLYLRKGEPAFIIGRFGGHVFVRTEPEPPGPKKAHIAKVYGPSLPQVFVTRIVREAMHSSIREVWPKRFAEELNYQLQVRG